MNGNATLLRRPYRRRVWATAAVALLGAAVTCGAALYLVGRRARPAPPVMTGDATRVHPETDHHVLDRREFKRRVSEIFPDTHLTTISVVHGVALALLIGNFLGLTPGSTEGTHALWRRIPYAVPSLGLIITISFEYYYFVAVYRWSPKFVDACMPYLLGICEIGAIYYLDDPRTWWWWNVALAVVGALAFLNTWMNCHRLMFRTDEMYAFVRRYVAGDIAAAVALGLVSAAVALGYRPHANGHLYSWWDLASIVFIGGLAFLSWRAHRFIRTLHGRLGERPGAAHETSTRAGR